MDRKINLGIIMGGRSGEHEVSLMSTRSVLGAVNPDKYRIFQIGITHDGKWVTGDNVLDAFVSGNTDSLDPAVLLPEPGKNSLYAVRSSASGSVLDPITDLDVIFPVLHGTYGEDGTLQGFLEMADIAYVGAGVLGSSVGMDKGLFKDVMRANGIPVLDSMVVSRSEIKDQLQTIVLRAEKMAPYPLFVKPANLGSSVGVSRCTNKDELIAGMKDAARYDRRLLVEKGLSSPHEIEVSVLGNDNPKISIPGEIHPSDSFYSYNAKYSDDRSELVIPAPLPTEIAEYVRQLARRAFLAADCAGMARVDFLLSPAFDEVYLNEINTIPGFTHISMYPKLWEASGISYPQLIDHLINLALERKEDRNQNVRQYGR